MAHDQGFDGAPEQDGTPLPRDLEVKSNEWLIEAVENIGKNATSQTVELDETSSVVEAAEQAEGESSKE